MYTNACVFVLQIRVSCAFPKRCMRVQFELHFNAECVDSRCCTLIRVDRPATFYVNRLVDRLMRYTAVQRVIGNELGLAIWNSR